MSWWRFYHCAGWVLGLELKELYKVVQKREEDDRQNVDQAVPDTSLVRKLWVLDVDERSKKGNIVQTYQVPAERFTNVEVSLQCHSYHSVNAPLRYIEMFLRIICQGSHSHSAWQDDPFCFLVFFYVSECRFCLLLVFYADVQNSMLC